MRPISRRGVLVGCTIVLAGCTGDGGDAAAEEDLVEDEPDYADWLDDVDYPGTVDRTGESETGVEVGTGSGGLDFGPVAIRVEQGTTVVWEWTGSGGLHDVVHTNDAFASEQAGEEGHTFEHTFEETGIFTYRCVPHERQGMKGAVEVV